MDVARLDKVDYGLRPADVRHAGLEPAEVIGQVPVDVQLEGVAPTVLGAPAVPLHELGAGRADTHGRCRT